MNRFNNFFQGAAGLFFHKSHIHQFFNDFNDSFNLKLESVLLDCDSEKVSSLIRALGIIYYAITGPFWNLLKSETHYLDQYRYIQEMLSKFEEWSQDSSILLSTAISLFPDFAVPIDDVWRSLLGDSLCGSSLTKLTLEKIMAGFIKVTKKQLEDFLPGGVYGSASDDELKQKMKQTYKPCFGV